MLKKMFQMKVLGTVVTFDPPVFVCVCRFVEVSVSTTTGLPGSGVTGRADWLMCLFLWKSQPHPWHWSPSLVGW